MRAVLFSLNGERIGEVRRKDPPLRFLRERTALRHTRRGRRTLYRVRECFPRPDGSLMLFVSEAR